MKRFRFLVLTLFAVMAVGAVVASSAFAISEWLFNNKTLAAGEELAVETAGTVSLEDMGTKTEILCSGTFDGTIGPGDFDLVTKILNTGGVEENPINCELMKPGSCEEAIGSLIMVEAMNLPWLTEILLITVGGVDLFVDMFMSGGTGKPNYLVTCHILGLPVTATCEGEPGAELKVVGNNVEGNYNEEEAVNPAGLCSPSGGAALIKGTGTTSSTGNIIGLE